MTARIDYDTDRPTLEQWRTACPSLTMRGRELVGPCPNCGGTDRFHVRQDGIFGCRGCNDYKAILAAAGFWRSHEGGLTPQNARKRPSKPRSRTDPPNTPENVSAQPTPSQRAHDPGTGAYAAKLWAAAVPIPDDSLPLKGGSPHPARKWAGRRNLWDPSRPWPVSMRWLHRDALVDGKPAFRYGHTGAGSIIAAVMPLDAWRGLLDDDSPDDVEAAQLLALDEGGKPAKDRQDQDGLDKRTLGLIRGKCAFIPQGDGQADALHVVEGVADALAVASDEALPVAAVLGTAGFASLAQGTGFGELETVMIWADGDEPGRKATAKAARLLKINHPEIRVSWRELPDGQDPASLGGVAR